MSKLYFNIKQIVTCSKADLGILYGTENENLAIAVNRFGKIEEIGDTFNLRYKHNYAELIDCEEGSVIPGFVDAHTHPVWAGDRVHEFAMKLAGSTYLDIHKAGGGINYSVRATAEASEETLYKLAKQRLLSMLKNGTTTAECKSGYGLFWETEKKLLKVLTDVKKDIPMDLSITYLAAHAIPPGMTAKKQTLDIVESQLPKLKESLDQLELCCDNIDVFCEKGIFEIEESKEILENGKLIGLQINAHADELFPLGGTEMIASLGAKAISHLEEISLAGINALKENDVTAVLLPTTAYLLRLKNPPVRMMLELQVRCALGSDFNPNAYCFSMPLVMNLACVNFRMTMAEALLGATINAAYALGLENRIGSIEINKQADFLVLNVSNWENIIYQLGQTTEIIKMVVKKGKRIDFTQL